MTSYLSLLEGLPRPTAIQEIDYDTILAAKVADLVARFPALSPYINLETEPARISLEENAYREVLIRAAINDAFRQTLLSFATGSALDFLGVFYDAPRLLNETDEAYRFRISIEIAGRSPGGTVPRYRAKALGASIEMRDAIVYRDGLSPVVNVAIISTAVGGVAGAPLLATVTAALNDPAVRMVNDTIVVRSAVTVTQNIVADVWLLPEASDSLFATLPVSLQADWTLEAGLGFNLTRAWLVARLMKPGVQRVSIITPAADLIVQPFEALALGTITLNNMGRDV